MSPSIFKDIPELTEENMGEAMKSRTNSIGNINELGPPDLCHILKSNSKINSNESSYHYVLGTDASTSASLATYINGLINSMENKNNSKWISLATWKITNGIYCCYNAFSKIDVRVEVQIPGGVVYYMIDSQKKRCTITNELIWYETYVSAVLRAILYDDDYMNEFSNHYSYPLAGVRRMDIFQNPDDEDNFLQIAKILFKSAHKLGSNDNVISPTFSNNYLVKGIVKYFTEIKKHSKAINFFSQFYPIKPEIGSVIAKLYFDCNREIEGIEMICNSIKKEPNRYELLLTQAEFLRSKRRYKQALVLAKKAVASAVSEFHPWELLTNLYIDLDEIESALQALNSCPMFNNRKKDVNPKNFITPYKQYIPYNYDIPTVFDTESRILEDLYEYKTPLLVKDMEDVNKNFKKLVGSKLTGTFKSAYHILIRILNKIGWDNLLQFRSKVFVMEEEYKLNVQFRGPGTDKKEKEEDKNAKLNNASGRNHIKENSNDETEIPTEVSVNGNDNLSKEDATELTIMETSEEIAEEEEIKNKKMANKNSNENKIRIEGNTIRISDEKEDMEDKEVFISKDSEFENEIIKCPSRMKDSENDDSDEILDRNKIKINMSSDDEDNGIQIVVNSEESEKEEAIKEKNMKKREANSRPVEKQNQVNAKKGPKHLPRTHSYNITTSSKRLCERWLDSMFMVVYEDLRIFSLYQIETKQPYLVKSFTFFQSAKEWELYGDLALRLGYKNEALDSFIRSFNKEYSVNCLKKILVLHTEFNEVEAALNIINQLVIVKEFKYEKYLYPNEITVSLLKLINKFGIEKVQNVATNMDHYMHIMPYFRYIEKLEIDNQ